MWYLELHPLDLDRARLVHAALFPRSRTQRPDFEALAQDHYKRWDSAIEEHIIASERQQRGRISPFCLPGGFSQREPRVHATDNWVPDRVLAPA